MQREIFDCVSIRTERKRYCMEPTNTTEREPGLRRDAGRKRAGRAVETEEQRRVRPARDAEQQRTTRAGESQQQQRDRRAKNRVGL